MTARKSFKTENETIVIDNIFWKFLLTDIRKAEHVKGRSINLALSTRGRTALRMVGLEDEVIKNGIPMHARMIHKVDGSRQPILYGKKDQVFCDFNSTILEEG